MKQQKLSNWLYSSLALSVFVALPAKADLVQKSNEVNRPATTVEEWLSQSPTTNSESQFPVQIIGVQLNSTADGIEIFLKTVGGEVLNVSTSTEVNSLIINIPNAQLQLPEREEFSQDNPVEGIANVALTATDVSSVQVIVTGVEGIPTGEVFQSQQGLVISLATPEIIEEIEEIEIVVTAEKQPEALQDVPISVTAITQQEIEDSDITSLSDIAGSTPNFSTFTPSRNFILYSVRGLSNSNFLSRDPVAFFVDDVPYDYNGFLDLDLTDLERVEVLRGPQSTLYGRNAQAGVVNIVTRKPTNNLEFNTSASYANFDNPDFRAGISGPLVDDKLFFRLSGSFASRDGYTENDFLDSDVDFQSGGTGRGQLLWTPSENWDISVNASFDDYRDGALPTNLLSSEPFEVEQNFDGFSDLNSNTQSIKLAYNNPGFRFTSITARRFSDQDYEQEVDITTADLFTQVVAIDSTVFTQEIRLQSPEDSEKFEWFLGSYFESRDFNVGAEGLRFGADSANPRLDIRSAEIDETTFAVFGQASYRPIKALTLTAGLRYESFDSTLDNRDSTSFPADGSPPSPSGASFDNVERDGDEVLPRFIAQYRFNSDIMLYGSITRGYKPPGVNYRAEDEQLLTFDEEKSWNYEVGLKSSWLNNRLTANLAFFHNEVDDFQTPIPDETGLFREVANAQVGITGFEAEVRATPMKGLSIIAGFGFVDAEFTDFTNPFTGENFDGNELSYSPDFTYNLAVQYRAPVGILARVELQGVGPIFFNDANEIEQGSFALLNARLGYELDNYGIYLFANNITDVEHLVSAGVFPGFGTLVTYGAPATFGVQVRTRF
ncbi:MAG: TonB-dependent receptor [Symploca sp. SIO3C6]|nr:TonB-dependent receptor [Symploca sp. SIO3C6]